MDFDIDNLRLPQVEQCKRETEEMHDQESNKFGLEALKNEIVPYKDPKNDDYRLLKDDKVSNCFPLSNLSFQMLGNSFLLSSWCGGLCSL